MSAAPETQLDPARKAKVDWTPERVSTFRQATTQFFLGTTANAEQDERHFANLRRFMGGGDAEEELAEVRPGSFDSEGYGAKMAGCSESEAEALLEAEQADAEVQYQAHLEYLERAA